jgi:hypothetical protein
MLSEAELDPFFDKARTEWFRLEALHSYTVDVEQPRLRAYLAGEPYESVPEPAAWYEEIRRRTDEGVAYRKVRVVCGPLGEYERWELEWGYTGSERHGQRTFIIDLAETRHPPQLPAYDWWMLDERVVLRFHYDDDGTFLGAVPIEDPGEVAEHVRHRDAALAVATRFPEYWKAHPQYWRENWLDAPGMIAGPSRLPE